MRADTFLCLTAVVASVLCLPPSAGAQEQTGSVEGVVRDQQRAVVERASVEARNLAVGSALVNVVPSKLQLKSTGRRRDIPPCLANRSARS